MSSSDSSFCSSDDQFADAVISEIFEGGGYYFEYTSPGKVDRGNEKIFVGTMDCGIEDADWEEIERKGNKEEMKIQLTFRTDVPVPPHLVTKVSETYVPVPPHPGYRNLRYAICNTVRDLCPSTTTHSYKGKVYNVLHSQNLCPSTTTPIYKGKDIQSNNTVRTYVSSTTTPIYKVRFKCNTVRTYVPAPPHLSYKGKGIQSVSTVPEPCVCTTTISSGTRTYVPAPHHLTRPKVKIIQCVTQSGTYVQHHHVTRVRLYKLHKVQHTHLFTRWVITDSEPMSSTTTLFIKFTKVGISDLCNTVGTYVPAPPHLVPKSPPLLVTGVTKGIKCVTQSDPMSQHHHTVTKVKVYNVLHCPNLCSAPPHQVTSGYTICNTVKDLCPSTTTSNYTMFTIKVTTPNLHMVHNLSETYVPAPPHLFTSTTTPIYKGLKPIYTPIYCKQSVTRSQNLCPSTTTPSYKVRYTICNTVRTYVPAPPHLVTKVRHTMCNTVRTYVPAPPHLFTKGKVYNVFTVRTYVPAPPHQVTKVMYTMCNTVRTYVPAPPHLFTKLSQNLCPSTPPHLVTKVQRYTMCNTVRTYVPAPPHLVTRSEPMSQHHTPSYKGYNVCYTIRTFVSTTTPIYKVKVLQSVTPSQDLFPAPPHLFYTKSVRTYVPYNVDLTLSNLCQAPH
ncbi:unnamed protein product [Mytilus edulis]|uniref:Uncharacterized protein n=1 Tax=Mytilus edulis TaxID=6550 RepID=A0A8S3SVS8_MYTED|nr:unnamed protein product [Mytilus edulis]